MVNTKKPPLAYMLAWASARVTDFGEWLQNRAEDAAAGRMPSPLLAIVGLLLALAGWGFALLVVRLIN